MNLTIRQEQDRDYEQVEQLIQSAFLKAEHTDGDEHNLVARLREGEGFIPELSLAGFNNDVLVGHILFTPILIEGANDQKFHSLALAPVSVNPDWQHQGIGGQLILHGHEVAKTMGFGSVILLGHPDYYPRFGYQPASKFNIAAPFDVPDEAFMALELTPGSLSSASGVVRYPPEFGI